MRNPEAVGQQLDSLQALMGEIVDYAGIFPPGNLPLEEAVKNYRKYLDDTDNWMLRSFVLPIAKLNEVEKYMDLFSNEKQINFSLVLSKTNTAEEFITVCKKDKEEATRFLNKYKDCTNVISLEVPLPPVEVTENILQAVSDVSNALKAKAFCEMTKPLSATWIDDMKKTLASLQRFNIENPNNELGYKLRMGGVRAELFPTTEQVAHALKESIDRKIEIKFTAGLHHPVRFYSDDVQTKMHGFLNLFCGYMFQYLFNLNLNELEAILQDENETNFVFSNNQIQWKEYKVSLEMIKHIRQKMLCSFGSCSFDEPREDLRKLNIMK